MLYKRDSNSIGNPFFNSLSPNPGKNGMLFGCIKTFGLNHIGTFKTDHISKYSLWNERIWNMLCFFLGTAYKGPVIRKAFPPHFVIRYVFIQHQHLYNEEHPSHTRYIHYVPGLVRMVRDLVFNVDVWHRSIAACSSTKLLPWWQLINSVVFGHICYITHSRTGHIPQQNYNRYNKIAFILYMM